jgi:hypothetical protein
LLTAVALELVAGKTWAAGLTRKPGAGLDHYSTTRGFQLEEPPAAFGRRGRLGCPRPRKSHTDSTDGMLVTRGRGYRPRVGLPLGHPGPVCRQTEQDEEEHVAAVSGRGPRTALHGVTGTARLRRVDGSLRKPGRPGGWTLGHHPGRSPCALAALKLFAPALPGLGYGLALATARHGPDHEASPCARHAAGPRTDSDGTSPTAFTTAQMGGDCAWTGLLRNVPNRKTHAAGPGRHPSFYIRPARGPRPPGTSTSSRPLRARIEPTTTAGPRPEFYYR